MILCKLLLLAPFGLSTGTQAPADGTTLEAALAAVQADRYRADLNFMASDSMRGRNTPSPELRIAALFIKARVERLGFQPGAEQGWFQDYDLHSWKLAGDACSLVAESTKDRLAFAFGEDYYFMLASHAFDSKLSAGVVCAGTGSKKTISDVDLEGKWALLLDTGKVARRSIQRCFDAGAVGVIATPGPGFKREPYNERYGKRVKGMLASSRPGIKRRADPKSTDPIVMLDRDAAQRLFALSGVALEEGFPALGATLEIKLIEERRVLEESNAVSNICAFWPGSDPELAGETMIVSAHYDHVGERNGEIYNGADDNASGTCGLLALADGLVANGPLKRSVLLLWVSGEEKGLWGSAAWAKAPWLPGGAQGVLDLNIDMIGRTETDELYITPSREHDAFNAIAELAYSLCTEEGFPTLESQDEYWSRSDHMNFYRYMDIPVAFLSTGNHPDYHKPTDTPDKIDCEKATRVVRLIFRMLYALQDADLSR